jgi:hypothetical protein
VFPVPGVRRPRCAVVWIVTRLDRIGLG